MEISEIKNYIETNKDNEEVKAYLQELTKVTVEGVDEFVKSDEGKKWIGKQNDSFFSKSLESWKKNNLEKILEDKYKELHPEPDTKDVELRKLQQKIENIEKEKLKETLTNKALKIANEKSLPTSLIDYFVSDSEENTVKNLEKLETVFSESVQKSVEKRLKDGNYTPPGGGSDEKDKDITEFKKGLGL